MKRDEEFECLISLLVHLSGKPRDRVAMLVLAPTIRMLSELDLPGTVGPIAQSVLYATTPWRAFIARYRSDLKRRLVDDRGSACDVCNTNLGVEMHEAFVTRAHVPGWKQFFIFCPQNTVLLCHHCHEYAPTDYLLFLQQARGYALDEAGRWPEIREILKGG